jgi:hypothetical protein
MRIVLALAVFTASISSIAIAEARVGLICTKSSQQTSGLTKICYYNCAGTEGAMTVQTYDPCPRWTPHWRLNRTGPFGPSANFR